MTKLYNRTSDREKRKLLRNNMTDAEKALWESIRKRQIKGYKFRRQFSICGFIVDFYCPRLKLAIEVDGNIHLKGNRKIYDKEREKLLCGLGIEFLRFTNNEVFKEREKVNTIIRNKIKSLN